MTKTTKANTTNDGLSRCDECHKITPHDKLIQVRDRKTDTMGYYCSMECVVASGH